MVEDDEFLLLALNFLLYDLFGLQGFMNYWFYFLGDAFNITVLGFKVKKKKKLKELMTCKLSKKHEPNWKQNFILRML